MQEEGPLQRCFGMVEVQVFERRDILVWVGEVANVDSLYQERGLCYLCAESALAGAPLGPWVFWVGRRSW